MAPLHRAESGTKRSIGRGVSPSVRGHEPGGLWGHGSGLSPNEFKRSRNLTHGRCFEFLGSFLGSLSLKAMAKDHESDRSPHCPSTFLCELADKSYPPVSGRGQKKGRSMEVPRSLDLLTAMNPVRRGSSRAGPSNGWRLGGRLALPTRGSSRGSWVAIGSRVLLVGPRVQLPPRVHCESRVAQPLLRRYKPHMTAMWPSRKRMCFIAASLISSCSLTFIAPGADRFAAAPSDVQRPPTRGPLRVHPENPRYFADATGQARLLVGSHTWNNSRT
jgi:hypothetical protein